MAVPGFYGGDSRDLKVEVREGPARQYIITNIDMVCEVAQVDSAIQAIQRRMADIHGLIGRLSLSTTADSQKTAQLYCLVPSSELTATLEWLGSHVSKVKSQTISSREVSEEYDDIDARLRNKKAAERRIRDVLVVAKTATEIVEIEKALADLRSEIDALEGRKKELLSKVEYARITLSLLPSVKGTEDVALTLWAQIVLGFKQGANGFGDVLRFCVRVLIAGIPAIVFAGLLAWVVQKFVFRMRRRGKAVKNA
jgi:archaellum component FlaC